MKATLTIAGLYNYRPDLFDLMKLPDGVDRENVIWQICEECSSLETRFPDPDYLKLSLDNWSAAMLESWKRRLHVMLESYDPLHNFDRHEDIEENITTSDTSTGAKTAFNEDSFKNTDRVTGNGQSGRTMKTHLYGNIGVTKSQEMLMDEEKLTTEGWLNFYRSVAEDFKHQYCILVY